MWEKKGITSSPSAPSPASQEQTHSLTTLGLGWGREVCSLPVPSKGCLGPPLIDWNVGALCQWNEHFPLRVRLVDIFISSPGSKSHILAREEVKSY